MLAQWIRLNYSETLLWNFKSDFNLRKESHFNLISNYETWKQNCDENDKCWTLQIVVEWVENVSNVSLFEQSIVVHMSINFHIVFYMEKLTNYFSYRSFSVFMFIIVDVKNDDMSSGIFFIHVFCLFSLREKIQTVFISFSVSCSFIIIKKRRTSCNFSKVCFQIFKINKQKLINESINKSKEIWD
jgi:hypothetical protein